MNVAKHTLRTRLKLILGTPRRFLWNVCRPGYVRANLKRRQGACRRCGACCRLAWRCRYFFHDKGVPACRLYGIFRFPNCSNFPIDHRDLADRDLIAPHTPCGYWWESRGT